MFYYDPVEALGVALQGRPHLADQLVDRLRLVLEPGHAARDAGIAGHPTTVGQALETSQRCR